jgi:hypothetical protein
MTCRPILLTMLTMIMLASFPLQAFSAGKEPVKPSRQWSGSVQDLSLKEVGPEVILSKQGLENLWRVWKIPGPVPEVDFFRELVVVQTTRGSRLRLTATLDESGNLEVLGLATRDLHPGFRYVIAILSNKRVKTVNGQEVKSKAEKTSLETSSAQDCIDFGVFDIEVHSVKTLDTDQLNAEISRAAGQGEIWPKDALLVALKFIGTELKGHTKTIEVRTPPEQRDAATITITASGYLDDAIGGERWRLWLDESADGIWTIRRALWAQLCHRPGRKFYSAEKCP